MSTVDGLSLTHCTAEYIFVEYILPHMSVSDEFLMYSSGRNDWVSKLNLEKSDTIDIHECVL